MASPMYRISPVAPIDGQIDLPTCMYRMAPAQGGSLDASASTSQGSTSAQLSSTESLSSLEQRQLATIADLKDLQHEVRSLATRLNIALPPMPGTTSDQQIVVHASPKQPPTAVIVLFRLLAQQLPVTTAVYLHSSLKSLAAPLANILSTVPVVSEAKASQAIRLVVVWREVPNDEPYMVVRSHSAGLAHCSVCGQQNIGRYLCRSYLTGLYEGLGVLASLEIDILISTIYLTLLPGSQASSKETASALKQANVALGRRNFLAGDRLSLADVLLYPLLSAPGLTLGNNVKAWVKKLASDTVLSCAA